MGNDNHGCLAGWPLNNKPPVRQELNSWANLPSIVLHDIFLLLDHNDRINASSICHSWRQALYHPNFWHEVRFNLNPTLEMQKSCYLMSACSHLVRETTISYMSLSMWCVYELTDLLQRLSKNYNLRKLTLEPSHCHLLKPENCKLNFFERCILKPLLVIASRLESFSLGCTEEFCNNLPRFLETMAKSEHPERVHKLGFASVKDDPGNYLIIEVDVQMFSAFTNLKILSVDYDYMSDRFLECLQGAGQLERMVVHVHGLWDGHPGTTDRAWSNFCVQHPTCTVRLTLIHAYEAVHSMQERILHQAMPLSHLKVFFCEELNVDILNLLSSWYRSTLRSIIWVDSRTSHSVWTLVQLLQRNIPDPLVMAAWTCSKLEEIVLLGYKYFEEDIIAIARLRGDVMKRIHVADEDVIYSHEVYRALPESRSEVSQILGYDWAPIPEDDIHPVIKDATAGDSDDYLLPIVLADLN